MIRFLVHSSRPLSAFLWSPSCLPVLTLCCLLIVALSEPVILVSYPYRIWCHFALPPPSSAIAGGVVIISLLPWYWLAQGVKAPRILSPQAPLRPDATTGGDVRPSDGWYHAVCHRTSVLSATHLPTAVDV